MNQARLERIDFLRAFAIIGVMIIHTFSYNFTSQINWFIWNYLHFVEVIFVFCSGFILTTRYKEKLTNTKNIFIWIKKRCIRLLIPYYMYLIIHFILWVLFPTFFSGLGLERSLSFITASITFTGGIGLNWLPLLFLQLTLWFPLYLNIPRQYKALYMFSVIIVIGLFTITVFPSQYYKLVMWLPWSLVSIVSISVYKLEAVFTRNKRIMVFLITASFCLLAYLFFWNFNPFHRSLTLFDNKYPPNLYYFSYAIAGMFFALALSEVSLLKRKGIKNIYTFLSKQSYSLFFIHYIVLDFVVNLRHRVFFLNYISIELFLVVSTSILISYILSFSLKKFRQ